DHVHLDGGSIGNGVGGDLRGALGSLKSLEKNPVSSGAGLIPLALEHDPKLNQALDHVLAAWVDPEAQVAGKIDRGQPPLSSAGTETERRKDPRSLAGRERRCDGVCEGPPLRGAANTFGDGNVVDAARSTSIPTTRPISGPGGKVIAIGGDQ